MLSMGLRTGSSARLFVTTPTVPKDTAARPTPSNARLALRTLSRRRQPADQYAQQPNRRYLHARDHAGHRHRKVRTAMTCALSSAPCTRRRELGFIGAHLFELVGTIVRGASAQFKMGPD